MPPPRLPRHLRPCHPPWSAHQVRCAPETSRYKSYSVRDDPPQSDASPTTPAPGWWKSLVNRVVSWEPSNDSKEPTAPHSALPTPPIVPSLPPPAPAPPAGTTPENGERTRAEDADLRHALERECSTGPSITKHISHKGPAELKRPPRRISRLILAPLPAQVPQSREQGTTGGEGEGAPEAKAASRTQVESKKAKTANCTSRIANQQATALHQHPRLSDAEGDARTPPLPSEHSTRRYAHGEGLRDVKETAAIIALPKVTQRGTSLVENHTPRTAERPALPPNQSTQHSQVQEHAVIQSKLQELLIQVKLLQDQLGQEPSSPMTSQQTKTHPAATSIEINPLTSAEPVGCVQEYPAARTEAASNPPKRWWKYSSRLPMRSSPTEHAISAALSQYRNLVWASEKVFLSLQDFKSTEIKPIVSVIHSRLRELARDTFFEHDRQLTAILKKYKATASTPAVPSIASTSMEPTGGFQSEMAPPHDELLGRARRAVDSTSQPIRLRSTAPLDHLTYKLSDAKLHDADSHLNEEALEMADNLSLDDQQSNMMMADSHVAESSSNQIQKKIDSQQFLQYAHPPSCSTNSIPSLESEAVDNSRIEFKTKELSVSTARTLRIPAPNAKGSSGFTSELQAKPMSAQLRAASEQSLLEELFPEASGPAQPHEPDRRDEYPKLDLPDSMPLVRREFVDRPQNLKEQVVASFQRSGERITALQLSHCSTELTEADFRHLIPKGKHIESWARNGDFYKIIPGRDPLSLERLPFYYLLFKTPESALAYQKNVSRLHKLSALHGSSSISSAIPPPKGFLEDGEDLATATSSYLLLPTTHELRLHTVMQPYNPALRSIIEQGGYRPIVSEAGTSGKHIHRVLVHIEGYEPSQWDLWQIFMRHAQEHGIIWPFHPESPAGIHRLREVVNLKTRLIPVSSVNPRAANQSLQHPRVEYDDPSINSLMVNPDDENSAKEINQMVVNRVYNRWIINFTEEDAARRFTVMWHRKVLPELMGRNGKAVWTDAEGVQMCNCEYLW